MFHCRLFAILVLRTVISEYDLKAIVVSQPGFSELENEWLTEFIRKSLPENVSVSRQTLKVMQPERLFELLVQWKEVLYKNPGQKPLIILSVKEDLYDNQVTVPPEMQFKSDLVDTFTVIFPSSNLEQLGKNSASLPIETSFCRSGTMKLNGLHQTRLFVTTEMLEQRTYPTNLVDYITFCSGLDYPVDDMTNACVNGYLVGEKCLCQFGFTGPRCQKSDLSDLNCHPGYAKLDVHGVPVCHCAIPQGGHQFCGEPPCPGPCEKCSRRHSGNVCGEALLETTIYLSPQNPVVNSQQFNIISTTKSTPAKSPLVNSVKQIGEDCGEFGDLIGKNCVCRNGYTGPYCDISPLELNCDWSTLTVTLPEHFKQQVENYYVPGGKFYLCQSEDECLDTRCEIESRLEHKQTDCGAKLSRKKSTVTVENNLFWTVEGLARYVHVGHYECIYENKISVTENRANITCCIAPQTLISQQNVFSVEPQLWRETKDSNFELITDSSSWIIDEPVILRLEKNDYKKVSFLDNSQLYFQTCTLTNSQDYDRATTRVPIVAEGCPTQFAKDKLGLSMSGYSTNEISLQFNAFNWKNGGQVFVHCDFNLCDGCSNTCPNRKRREVVHLKANMVKPGKVVKGPVNARVENDDNQGDLETKLYKTLSFWLSCLSGVIAAFLVYYIIKTVIDFTFSRK